MVRTLWGELVYQLGGKRAYEKIQADDDANATSPATRFERSFEEYGPCLILIDEWVAYARDFSTTRASSLPAASRRSFRLPRF